MTMFSDGMLLGVGANAPPIYIDSTLRWSSGSTSRAVTAPTGIVAGDLLFAVCWSIGASDTWSAPSGFSPAIATLSGSNASVALFSKIAGGSEPGSYTFTGSSSSGHYIMLFCYRNASAVSANNLATATIDTSDPKVASSMSVVAGRVLLAVCGLFNNGVTLTSPPSGMVLREQQFSNDAPRGAAYEEAVSATGASGTRLFDISIGISGAAFLVEIQ